MFVFPNKGFCLSSFFSVKILQVELTYSLFVGGIRTCDKSQEMLLEMRCSPFAVGSYSFSHSHGSVENG